jgi:hypothetical protein
LEVHDSACAAAAAAAAARNWVDGLMHQRASACRSDDTNEEEEAGRPR